MKEKKTHIISKIAAFALAIAIIAPTLVKFSHGLMNHEHEVCLGKSTSHLHQLDIDCEFYKFKLNTQYVHISKPIMVLETEHLTPKIESRYYFISDYQSLHFSLRGPPSQI